MRETKELKIIQSKAYSYLDERYDTIYPTKELEELGNTISVGLTETYIAGYKQSMEDFLKDLYSRYDYLVNENKNIERIDECKLMIVKLQQFLLDTNTFGVSFEKYIEDVKSHLDCNTSEEYKKSNIVYLYNDEEIDNDIEYFKDCYNNNLSAYKALLFFSDHLEDKKKIH